jgi:hypothetical protein
MDQHNTAAAIFSKKKTEKKTECIKKRAGEQAHAMLAATPHQAWCWLVATPAAPSPLLLSVAVPPPLQSPVREACLS